MARTPRKPSKTAVKAAADRAERRSRGEPEPEGPTPIDPAITSGMGFLASPTLAPDETKKVPPKFGRPTKYKPEYCQKVLDLGFEGNSKAQIAREIGVDRNTLDDWAKAHPDFSRALKMAKQLELAWWEDQGKAGLAMGRDFNAVAFIFQVKNRFRDDYLEKVDVRHDATESFRSIWSALATRGKATANAEGS
jgi:hypothetical protein